MRQRWNFEMAKNIKTDYGATGNGSTFDTPAFQSANNDIAAGLVGRIDIPIGKYLLGPLNGTGLQSGVFQGEGQGSELIVGGKDSAGNWFDLCGANNVSFRDLKIISDGITIPQVLFPWLQTTTSGVLGGLSFEHVDMVGNSNLAMVFGFGFGNVGQDGRGGTFVARDCSWTQKGNAAVFYSGNTLTPYLRNSVLQLTGNNSAGVRSANVTVYPGLSRAWGAMLDNLYAIDNASGYAGTGSGDHNASIILENVTNLLSNGGSIQGLCDATLIMWACQGAQFNSPQFLAADGGVAHVNRWIWAGGGLNFGVLLDNPFWSDPQFDYIDFGTPVMVNGVLMGGAWNWKISCNDVAGNGTVPFIGNIYGAGAWNPANPWLKNCSIETYAATHVITPGAIDAHTIFQGPVTVTVPAGATDTSHKF
jgi:hypothetical protein